PAGAARHGRGELGGRRRVAQVAVIRGQALQKPGILHAGTLPRLAAAPGPSPRPFGAKIGRVRRTAMSGPAVVRSLRPLSAVVVPGWLAEIVRPRRAPVPWPEMARAALAICVPLSVSFAAGRGSLGGLPGTLADAGGPYLSRVKRVCSAAVFGGAAGLAIGAVTHGHGWLAVVALVAVAGVSGLLSARGDIGSVTGLQLLVYTSLGAGPIGALRPVWHTAAGFLIGVVWALILILPGWLHAP